MSRTFVGIHGRIGLGQQLLQPLTHLQGGLGDADTQWQRPATTATELISA
jgi:hypothetical protein